MRRTSSTSAPTGSPTPANFRVETPASIRSITARVSGSRSREVAHMTSRAARARHRPSASAGVGPRHGGHPRRHRPIPVAVTARSSIGVVLALWPYDLIHLEAHQLMHDAEPDADAQCQQSLPRCPHELPEGLLNLRWQRTLRYLRGSWRPRRRIPSSWRFLLSYRTWLAPRTLPTGADEQEEPAALKFYEIPDNLWTSGRICRSPTRRDLTRSPFLVPTPSGRRPCARTAPASWSSALASAPMTRPASSAFPRPRRR